LSYYLERIQHGVDYIEERLDEDVALGDVAKAAGVSQWHFQRLFKSLTGETLKTYIRARRLAASLERLLTTDLRILDIAVLAGFESQEAFARAFKQAFGMTPQKYRSLRDKGLFLNKPRFDADYLRHIHQNVSLTPEILQQPSMLLVGLRTLFYGADSEKNNVARQLTPLWVGFLPRLEEIAHTVPGICYGVIRQDPGDGERLEYHAAIEVTQVGALPQDMVALTVPAATYARFEHRGPIEGLDHTVSYAYANWLARSEHRHSYAADLEIYGAGYLYNSPDSLIHYAIPLAT
jgi:AraC-like DNA-binding protein/predicted transcriptional regulator YdeE